MMLSESLRINQFVDYLLIGPAFIAAVVVRLLRPVVTIRFRHLPVDEIGPLTKDSQHYVRQQELEGSGRTRKILDVWYLKQDVEPCNRYMVERVSKQIRLVDSRFVELIAEFSKLLPGGAKHFIPVEKHWSLLEGRGTQFAMLDGERRLAAEYLCQVGIDTGQDFVALMVRDGAYKNGRDQTNSLNRDDKEDYRNHDINDYVPLAKSLAALGVQVIRMGAKVEQPLDVGSPLVIDYATSGLRTEMADIFLASECILCISTSLGLDQVAAMSGKPRVITNHLPIGSSFGFYSYDVLIPQRFLDAATGRELTLSESLSHDVIRDMNYYRDVIDRGLRFIRNSPSELVDVALEGLQRVRGQWVESADDLELQARYWSIYDEHFPQHKNLAPQGRPHIGSHFLRSHRRWLD